MLGAGETARLIMLFSNDRIICSGSFDSSLIISTLSPLASSLQRRHVLLHGVNNTASSNVASGNSEISRAWSGAKRKGGGNPEVSENRNLQFVHRAFAI